MNPFLIPPRVLVISGSRTFLPEHLELARPILASLHVETILRHGDQGRIRAEDGAILSGCDKLVGALAEELGFWVEKWPAQWKIYGPSAGPRRNLSMLVGNRTPGQFQSRWRGPADALLAFWDGRSRGTKGCIELARGQNLPVYVVHF